MVCTAHAGSSDYPKIADVFSSAVVAKQYEHVCSIVRVPEGSPSDGGDVVVDVFFLHEPTKLAHSFLFCSCPYFRLYGPFNCISFHKFSRQLSVFSLCYSDLISALLVL